MNRKRDAVNIGFRAELKRRYQSFKDGSARMYSWEETKQAASDRVAGYYSDEFKAELDRRYQNYLNGEQLFSESEVDERIKNTIARIASKRKGNKTKKE